MSQNWIPFNANNYVKVKLTDRGKAALNGSHAIMKARMRERGLTVPDTPAYQEDSEGYTKFQLWHLMQALGHLCGLGVESPFDVGSMLLCTDQ